MAGSHLTEPLQSMTYIGFFSINTLSIILAIYALNYLYVRFFDIRNSYLNVGVYQKVYFISRKYFEPVFRH